MRSRHPAGEDAGPGAPMPKTKPVREEDGNSAVMRVISLLEAVAQSGSPPITADLIHSLGLPKPTVHRLVSMLERVGLLEREPAGRRLVAGPRLRALALATIESSRIRGAWHSVLQSLSDQIGETCSFSMLYGNEVVVLDRIEANWGLRLQLPVGARVPSHCTSSGKLLLSSLPKKTRDSLIGKPPLKQFTKNTITDVKRLDAALAEIKKTRIGTDNEEYFAGLVGVAVPVLVGNRVAATVSVNAPAARMSLTGLLKHVGALQSAAADLSKYFKEPM
jgi:DNA-binding IclR family transcriptional regulator